MSKSYTTAMAVGIFMLFGIVAALVLSPFSIPAGRLIGLQSFPDTASLYFLGPLVVGVIGNLFLLLLVRYRLKIMYKGMGGIIGGLFLGANAGYWLTVGTMASLFLTSQP